MGYGVFNRDTRRDRPVLVDREDTWFYLKEGDKIEDLKPYDIVWIKGYKDKGDVIDFSYMDSLFILLPTQSGDLRIAGILQILNGSSYKSIYDTKFTNDWTVFKTRIDEVDDKYRHGFFKKMDDRFIFRNDIKVYTTMEPTSSHSIVYPSWDLIEEQLYLDLLTIKSEKTWLNEERFLLKDFTDSEIKKLAHKICAPK